MAKAKAAVAAEPVGIKIDQDVIDLIKSGAWSEHPEYGTRFVMPLTKDRKLYEKTAKVLESLGGKWNRGAKGTVFENEDAETAIHEACETGIYIDPKKTYQFFETPPAVAQLMIEELNLGAGTYTVLEPSAGNGALIVELAKACTDTTDVTVTAVELDLARQDLLDQLTGSTSQVLQHVIMYDFLTLKPTEFKQFDRVIMNPPFSKSQDIKHVLHAYKFLKPGGILVAVMSPGFTFRSDNTASSFRGWLDLWGSTGRAYYTPLPPGSFKASGTNVNTVLLTIQKGK